MKIKLLSDVHLEFGDFDPGKGDVLVLAGDICVAAYLLPESDERDKYLRFFNKCVENYNKVFYVMGNHEHYQGDWNKTESIIRSVLPSKISILQNQVETYEGVNFVGATLWTNMNNLNQNAMAQAQATMNDYHSVVREDKMLSPIDTIESHVQTRGWLNDTLPGLEGPVFVITHHAPSTQSVKGRYVSSEHFYSNEMEEFIKLHSNITNWVHGHIHESSDYQVGQCRIVTNPRGYHGMELNPNFNPELIIEVPSTPSTNSWRF